MIQGGKPDPAAFWRDALGHVSQPEVSVVMNARTILPGWLNVYGVEHVNLTRVMCAGRALCFLRRICRELGCSV